MRLHLLGLPNAPIATKYSLDGFSQATSRFARMMKDLGHAVFVYGAEGSDAVCDEFIQVISEEERTTLLDYSKCQYQHAWIDERSPIWQLANPRTIREIAKRKQPRDFICQIGGGSQKAISDAHPDLLCVEYSIGYTGSFAPFRVFESNVWRHCTYGFQHIEDGRFFDEVIPMFFDPEELKFQEKKEPFALYVGRLIGRKGISIACKAAAIAGIPLKVVGHGGDTSLITDGAEYLGALGLAERNDLMARAQVVICPTQYLEPFGCVAVEAQMCGTPVVSTDFGAFTETVEQGKTGFRCKYLGEFVAGIRESGSLNTQYIRDRAIAKYSMHNIKHQYQAYFERLSLLWGQGWNSLESPSAIKTGTI